MSSMSSVSSSVADAPAPDKSNRPPAKVLIAGGVVVVLFIVLLLLMLTGGGSAESKGHKGTDGGGGGGDDGGDINFGGGGGKNKDDNKPTPAPTPPPTPAIIPIKRPESFVFCTVGPSLESGFRMTSVPACDYFVYTDVFAYKDDAHSQDDPVSYSVFLDTAKKYRDDLDYRGYPPVTNSSIKLQHYGLSFTADDLKELSTQVGSVNFKNLYKQYGILTAGIAGYSRGAVASDSTNLPLLKTILKAINDGLSGAQAGNTTILKTVFLGVKLAGATASSQYDTGAMNELKGISDIDVLILVSHLLQPMVSDKCTIQPLSMYSGTVAADEAAPSWERLTSLVITKGLPFRIALSISMSVFLFTTTSIKTAAIGQECQMYHKLSYSELCGVDAKSITVLNPLKGTATALSKSATAFMVFETADTIQAKMTAELSVVRAAGVAMVWAVYDLHNDLAVCELTDQPQQKSYVRFKVVNDTMAKDYKKKDDDDSVRRGVLLSRRRRRLW